MVPDDLPAQENSASPMPPPPVESTPGPRASALQTAYEKALEATMKKCSYDNFSSCFPTTAEVVPGVLIDLHGQFTTRLQSECMSDFIRLLEDRDVTRLLNSLDALINDGRSRKSQLESIIVPIATHTLQPQELLDAHLAPFLAKQEASLTSALAALDGRNAILVQAAESQGTEISAYLTSLGSLICDIEQGANLVQDAEMQALTEDIKTISQEMNA